MTMEPRNFDLPFSAGIATGFSVPIVMLMVWIGLQRMKSHWDS